MLDLGHRVDDAGYAHIMVDGSDEISGVLRQINIKVPGALQQLRLAVGQVGAQHSLDDAVIVGFVELIQTGSEQREGGAGKDVLGTAHLQLIADVQHGLAGSDNIIGNEDVLTLDILAQVFMGNNGVAAIPNAAVITALVEHTQVAAQHAGIVHVAVHGAFIRGNDQEVLLAEVDIRYMVQQALEHLIGGHNVIEAHQGHSVHYAGVMSIKSNNVLNAHGAQLLQSVSAVQAFAADAAMLAAAIQTGHDHADTVRTAGNSLDQADLLIGARRMVDSVKRPGQDVFVEYRSQEIRDYIDAHPEYDNIVIVLSGDVGFYSGARKLLEVLCQDSADLRVQRKNGSEKSEEERDSSAQNNTEIEIQCGISSVVYFMSQIGLSWDDAKIVSAHGRGCNLISHICYAEKVFSILGTSDGVAVLAEKLVKYGMGDVLLYVGENLSYENEKIFAKPASELTEYKGDSLSVICAVNENAGTRLETHGIRDEEFIRGKAPMTKEEVRTVSLSKLRLTADSVCYDVGAGTGSLSIEMALRAHQGQVWAIEKKEDAVELIHRNKVKFAADNLEIVEGLAPEALKDLPAPTHAFIGGSSGNLKEIVKLLLEKNPQVRIVINCITLETVSEALETAKEFGFEENEIVQLSAASSKAIGRYHMMMGENPIYIITLQNPGK